MKINLHTSFNIGSMVHIEGHGIDVYGRIVDVIPGSIYVKVLMGKPSRSVGTEESFGVNWYNITIL